MNFLALRKSGRGNQFHRVDKPKWVGGAVRLVGVLLISRFGASHGSHACRQGKNWGWRFFLTRSVSESRVSAGLQTEPRFSTRLPH
jgi:hypothetical protein